MHIYGVTDEYALNGCGWTYYSTKREALAVARDAYREALDEVAGYDEATPRSILVMEEQLANSLSRRQLAIACLNQEGWAECDARIIWRDGRRVNEVEP